MSNDIINFLQKVNIEIEQKQYSFVYFEKDSGKIQKISNKKDCTNELLELKTRYREVEELINGRKRLDDCRVVYNSKIKKFEIIDVKKKDQLEKNQNRFLKVLKTKQKQFDYDVFIVQDNINKKWNVKINDDVKVINGINNFLFFSITKKNDANILYRSIYLDLEKVEDINCIDVPYIYLEEQLDVSVFVNKIFNSYIHEVIND